MRSFWPLWNKRLTNLNINPVSAAIYDFGKTIKPVIFIRSLIEYLLPGVLTLPKFTPSRERGGGSQIF